MSAEGLDSLLNHHRNIGLPNPDKDEGLAPFVVEYQSAFGTLVLLLAVNQFTKTGTPGTWTWR
jgi:hypothetical protein